MSKLAESYVALDVLTAYMQAGGPVGYRELAERAGVHYNTALNVTRILCGMGLVSPARGGPHGSVRFQAAVQKVGK